MIITLEGAPAVGKSTTCVAIAQHDSAFVVPEVNKLFARPKHEPENWYLDRQVARWEMGIRQVQDYEWIVFDGDLFQPLWFSWIYHDEPWTNLEHCETFYRLQISENRIGFPDVYFFLSTTLEERWRREYKRGCELNRDEHRIREKYQRFEKLVEPQKRYFEALQSRFPGRVKFLESISVEANLELITSIPKMEKLENDIEIFNFLIAWLKANELLSV
jgi:thymidylate kinase